MPPRNTSDPVLNLTDSEVAAQILEILSSTPGEWSRLLSDFVGPSMWHNNLLPYLNRVREHSAFADAIYTLGEGQDTTIALLTARHAHK